MTLRRLWLVPHTHWDREWYRTHQAFRYRLVRLLDGLLHALEADPGFRHFTLDGQTIVLRDYLAIRPEARERIAKLVGAGRLSIGPWTVLPDEWLVSGEALVRNLRAGLAEAEAFGGGMEVGYVPDQFGHVGQLPQIFAGMGFPAALLWRGVGADVESTLFQWEAPDGTRLFTGYLRNGYGNAVHLPRDPRALAERLRAEASALEALAPIDTLLLMNGSDHVAPDPELPGRLRRAAEQLPDLTLEIGSLPGYLAGARERAPAELPLHRGELRSGLRAPILAGCASSRMPQKRADFENDRLLTRQLEPLAAWLERLAPGAGDPGLLDALWRMALENHPHDSICGCSVDAVHEEMDTRFRRVRELAEAHLAQVCGELGARIAPVDGEGTPIAVFGFHAGGRAEARGELELPLELEAQARPELAAADAAGRLLPVHARTLRGRERYADYRLPARVVAQLVQGFPPEFFGDPVCHAQRRESDEADVVTLWLGERPPQGFDWETRRAELARELRARGDHATHFRPQRMPRLELRLADAFPGAGLRSYRLREAGGGGAPAASGLRAEAHAGGARLENRWWRVEVSRRGEVALLHRATGLTSEDALALVSEGDRGDSYSFDPVPGDVPVERPEQVSVGLGECSAARAELRIDARYRLPAGLRPDRRARDDARVELPARLRLALAADLDRLEVRVECENTARDHRLRLRIAAPGEAQRLEVESAFEVVERPLRGEDDAADPRPAERADAATPQRRFATLVGRDALLCVASRGLAEVACVPGPGGRGALAVTLLRATGWLSRDDLARRPGHAGPPRETPGGQVPGRHVGEVALMLRAAGEREHRADALRFADPPLLFAGGGGADAPLRDGARLLVLDDPEVVLSALEPDARGGTGVRLYNGSDRARTFQLDWNGGGQGLARVDLRGRSLPDPDGPAPSRRLSLRPHEILSLRAR